MGHPFKGGVKKATVTMKHVPLIWECMLGAVYAMNDKRKVRYFDYDYAAAREYAGVAACSDLRIAKAKGNVNWTDGSMLHEYGPRYGRLALWGIRA
jgi:predicted metal-binding protein